MDFFLDLCSPFSEINCDRKSRTISSCLGRNIFQITRPDTRLQNHEINAEHRFKKGRRDYTVCSVLKEENYQLQFTLHSFREWAQKSLGVFFFSPSFMKATTRGAVLQQHTSYHFSPDEFCHESLPMHKRCIRQYENNVQYRSAVQFIATIYIDRTKYICLRPGSPRFSILHKHSVFN